MRSVVFTESVLKNKERNVAVSKLNETETSSFTLSCLLLYYLLLPEGSGPIPDVLQYRANPWGSRSKLLHLPPVPKISLISMSPDGGRIRY